MKVAESVWGSPSRHCFGPLEPLMDEFISDWWRYNREVWLTGIVKQFLEGSSRWWSKVGCMSICPYAIVRMVKPSWIGFLECYHDGWNRIQSIYIAIYNHIGLSKLFEIPMLAHRFQPSSHIAGRCERKSRPKETAEGDARGSTGDQQTLTRSHHPTNCEDWLKLILCYNIV